MADGQIYELIHDIIEMAKKASERPDSIEFGQASNRKKVYGNASRPAEWKLLVNNAKAVGFFADEPYNPENTQAIIEEAVQEKRQQGGV